uniref:Wsv161-like protein n=1 Tax=Metapenaeus ensis nimavirus TaxID=2133794 RepID=A0A401IPA9_9VIRU|nr:MAG: wsv161-like protein [Metapenaeus ensis nimavirus]GBG35454.1 wsv161-like protein [Metapenaeus ensis nimavirus]
MTRSKQAREKIIKNVRNKKEDERRKKALRSMNFRAAEARAPSTSMAKVRRKFKKAVRNASAPKTFPPKADDPVVLETAIDDKNNTSGESERKNATGGAVTNDKDDVAEVRRRDRVCPQKAASMKRQLERCESSTTRRNSKRKIEERDDKKSHALQIWANSRGTIKSASVLVLDDRCLPFPHYNFAKTQELATHHRIRASLDNLLRATRIKALPTALSLKRGVASTKAKSAAIVSRTKGVSAFVNVGAEIARVCLAQPIWALVHRCDPKRGYDEWFAKSDELITKLNNGGAENANEFFKEIMERHLRDAKKERVYFEMMANVCNDLFDTRVLPNKMFDCNFVTLTKVNNDPTVRSLSIPRYFRSLTRNVWKKISEVMDVLLMGGRSGEDSFMCHLEECADNVIRRAKSRPVESTIKKAVEQANQANKLPTGEFKRPTMLQKQGGQTSSRLPVIPPEDLRGNWFQAPGYYNGIYPFFQEQEPSSAHASLPQHGRYWPGGAPPVIVQSHQAFPRTAPTPVHTMALQEAPAPTMVQGSEPSMLPTSAPVITLSSPHTIVPAVIPTLVSEVPVPTMSPAPAPSSAMVSKEPAPVSGAAVSSPSNNWSAGGRSITSSLPLLPPMRPPPTPGRDLPVIIDNRRVSSQRPEDDELRNDANLGEATVGGENAISAGASFNTSDSSSPPLSTRPPPLTPGRHLFDETGELLSHSRDRSIMDELNEMGEDEPIFGFRRASGGPEYRMYYSDDDFAGEDDGYIADSFLF